MSKAELMARQKRTIELYRSGMPLRKVASQCGVCVSTIVKDLQKAGEPRRSRGPSGGRKTITKRCRVIAEEYITGNKTLKTIALAHGITIQAVQQHVAKYRELTGGRS